MSQFIVINNQNAPSIVIVHGPFESQGEALDWANNRIFEEKEEHFLEHGLEFEDFLRPTSCGNLEVGTRSRESRASGRGSHRIVRFEIVPLITGVSDD